MTNSTKWPDLLREVVRRLDRGGSPDRNFPDRAPKPYQPGDFLLHLTNVDRLAILDQLGL